MLCIIIFYLQFIFDDWKFIAPKKILPDICDDKKDIQIISHLEDHIFGRQFKDSPDINSNYEFHAVYLLPCEQPDRKFDVNLNIQFSLKAVNKWFAIRAKGKKINFDKKLDNTIDVTFLRVNKTMKWFVDSDKKENNEDVSVRIEKIILSNANIFNNFNKKKFIVFFEGWEKRKSLFFNICGKSRYNGKVAIFFTNGKSKQNVGKNKKIFSCVKNDTLNDSDNEIFGKSEGTILHEILHSLGAPPKCGKNLDPESIFHVIDHKEDILYKISGETYLDYNNDDYYNHNIKNCPDLSESNYLVTAKF